MTFWLNKTGEIFFLKLYLTFCNISLFPLFWSQLTPYPQMVRYSLRQRQLQIKTIKNMCKIVNSDIWDNLVESERGRESCGV